MAGLQSQLQGMRSFVRRDLGRLPWGMAVSFVAACTVSYLVYVMNPGFTAAIMDSINHLRGRKTMIIIAHRLNTIENCDMIYRVENETIVRER